jgi:hypothetical protein
LSRAIPLLSPRVFVAYERLKPKFSAVNLEVDHGNVCSLMQKMVTWKIYDYMFHVSAYAISLVLTPVNLIIVTSSETETRQPSCFAFPVIDVNRSYIVLQGLTSHKVSELYSK